MKEVDMKKEKEYEEEVLQIDRVTRVVKGGRRLSFRVTVIIGNRKGKVGVGIGKATEVSVGIQKALSQAKKNVIRIPLTDINSIPHDIDIKYKSAKLRIMPARDGTGIIAGGATRKILELAGVKNVLSKSYGTNNRIVTSQATIEALKQLPQVADEKKKKKEPKDMKDKDMKDK